MTPPQLDFEDITQSDEETALAILRIRNEQGVRENMYTDHEIGPEEHARWIERLRGADDSVFFVVSTGGEIVGGVSISRIDRQHRRAEWAFYLSSTTQGRGIGSALEVTFVTRVFNEFGMEKLNCEVIAFNQPVIDMHQRFGFKIEGVRREHVLRDGAKHDTVLLGITKAEWDETLRRRAARAAA